MKKHSFRRSQTGKKYLALLLVLCVALCSCMGCGQRKQESEPSNKEEKITLDVWTFFDMNTPGEYYLSLWDTLAEEHGYEINVEFFTTEQIKDKLEIALACRELPDIFLVWGGTYPDFLFQADACLALQDDIRASGIDFKEDYILPYGDGNNYIIPCLVEAYAVTYYNQELLNKMQLTVPTNWDELLTLIDAVNHYNEKNHTDYAAIELGNKDEWLGELLYCTLVNRLDPTAFGRLERRECDMTDPVFTEAANRIETLLEKHAFNPDFLETGEVEAVENFIRGEAVLFPHQSTIMYYLNESMSESSVGMTQFPSCSEAYDETYLQYLIDINHTLTPGLCVSSRSAYPREAAALCLEFSEKVNQINITEYGYYNYTNVDLPMPGEVPAVVEQFHRMLDEAVQTTPYLYAILEKSNANALRSITKQLYSGKIDIEEFIALGNSHLIFPETSVNYK